MARYYDETPLVGVYTIRDTMGKRPYARMLAEEKVAKQKIGNPALWSQLDAVSRNSYVNHLGIKHRRDHGRHPDQPLIPHCWAD